MKKRLLLITAAIIPLSIYSANRTLVCPTFKAPVYVNLSGEESSRYDDSSKFDTYQTPFFNEVSKFRDNLNLDEMDSQFAESIYNILDLLAADENSNFTEAFHRAMDLVFLAIVDNSKEQVEQLAKLNELFCLKKPGISIFNSDPRDLYPLEWARYFKRFSLIRVLKNCGANKTTGVFSDKVKKYDNLKPVHFLALTGQFEEATKFVRDGEDFTGFPFDESGSCVGGMKSLLDYTLNFVDYKTDECLEFIQEIINRGYNINNVMYDKSIWVDIFYQPWNIKKIDEVIQFFIANGANPNCPIKSGSSLDFPLTLAIQKNDVKAVEKLLRGSADPNAASIRQGRGNCKITETPLSYSENRTRDGRSIGALESQSQAAIRKLLIEYGGVRTNQL